METFLNQNEENQLYDLVKGIININIEFDKPIIIEKDDCYCYEPESVFDTLGYFSTDFPDSIFLCNKNIEEYSRKHNQDIKLVYEIIYFHETAHYLHYHINQKGFNRDISNEENRKLFVESFAQLITHKATKDLSANHFNTFEYLKRNQSEEYLLYDEAPYAKKHPISACPKEVLFDVFLNSSIIAYIIDMVTKRFKTYIISNPISEFELTSEELERLSELNLLDDLNYCDYYDQFIQKD